MIGRLLGIDPGAKRIGLAISDALGVTARELAVLESQGDARDFASILEIARQEGAVGIIVGLPLNPNAPAGVKSQADIVREWIALLRALADMPVIEVSEYLTSDEARRLARDQKRGARVPIDDLAARVILQSYLDALSYGSATFPPGDSGDGGAGLY